MGERGKENFKWDVFVLIDLAQMCSDCYAVDRLGSLTLKSAVHIWLLGGFCDRQGNLAGTCGLSVSSHITLNLMFLFFFSLYFSSFKRLQSTKNKCFLLVVRGCNSSINSVFLIACKELCNQNVFLFVSCFWHVYIECGESLCQ